MPILIFKIHVWQSFKLKIDEHIRTVGNWNEFDMKINDFSRNQNLNRMKESSWRFLSTSPYMSADDYINVTC